MTEQNQKRRLFDQWQIANPWHRLVAQIIDQSLIGFFTGFVLNFWFSDKIWSGSWWMAWLLLWPFVSLATQCFCLLFFGTTPGKRPFGIVIKSANPTRSLTPWQILTRSCAWWMGALTLGSGWSTIISRGDRRAWHDIVAETIVVNPIAAAHRPNQFEKSFGHIWIVGVSLLFISILSWGLVYQIKALTHSNVYAHANFHDSSPLEKLAWTMLLKNELVIPKNLMLSESEQKLAQIMSHFSLSRETVDSERATYYKLNVEPMETELCKNDEAGSHCQTAKLLGRIVRNEIIDETSPLVPGAFEVLIKTRNMTIRDAADFFGKRALQAPLHSVEYLISKTEQAQTFISMGRFERAAQILQPDVVFFAHRDAGLGDLMNQDISASGYSLEILAAQNLIQTACQAASLNSCQSDVITQCSQLKYWSDWTRGCQMNGVPKIYDSIAQGLGFWWTQAQIPTARFQQKFRAMEAWELFKEKYRKKKLSATEREIFDALDFVLTAKRPGADGVMEKAQMIHGDSILFGWAHESAIREMGHQWLAVVNQPIKDHLARFNLLSPDPQPTTQAVAPAKVALKKDKQNRAPTGKKNQKKKKKK